MKYVFQQGGDATGANMFNQYVDQLLASEEQQQPQQVAQQPQTPEQDEYLENLRAYDEEFTLQRQSDEIDLRLNSIEQKLDAQIRKLTSMHEEFNYFNTSQGQEMIAQMYEAADETVPFNPYFNIGSTYNDKANSGGSSSGDKKGQAYNFFIQRGYAPHIAAGIVGNIEHESNFSTTDAGDGGKARGYAQWHPDRYEPLNKMFDLSTPEGNLQAIDYELRTSEKGNFKKILQARTPEEAAALVDKYYERSAGLSTKERMSSARNIFNSY